MLEKREMVSTRKKNCNTPGLPLFCSSHAIPHHCLTSKSWWPATSAHHLWPTTWTMVQSQIDLPKWSNGVGWTLVAEVDLPESHSELPAVHYWWPVNWCKIGITWIQHLLCKQKLYHLALIIPLPQQIYVEITSNKETEPVVTSAWRAQLCRYLYHVLSKLVTTWLKKTQ